MLHGINFLHRNNISNLNLKPENILLKDSKIKLSDFAIMKILSKHKLLDDDYYANNQYYEIGNNNKLDD